MLKGITDLNKNRIRFIRENIESIAKQLRSNTDALAALGKNGRKNLVAITECSATLVGAMDGATATLEDAAAAAEPKRRGRKPKKTAPDIN